MDPPAVIEGTSGSDVFKTLQRKGATLIFGRDGNDTFQFGDDGLDCLVGGPGNHVFWPGKKQTVVYYVGGDGADTFHLLESCRDQLTEAVTDSFSRRVPTGLGDNVPFEEHGELRSSCVSHNAEFDGYGNVKDNRSYCQHPGEGDPLERTRTVTTFHPSRAPWLIANPERVKTTSWRESSLGQHEKTRVVRYEYDLYGSLHAVTRHPDGLETGSSFYHRTIYERDDFDNITKVTERVATEEANRTISIVYDADNVFRKRCTKPIWQPGTDTAHKGACASSTQLSSGRS
jgi:hypothetical protein